MFNPMASVKAIPRKIKQEINEFELELPQLSSKIAPAHVWTNGDLDPPPTELRTWTATTWVLYWFSDVIHVNGWRKYASMIQLGLDWKNAFLATVVGSLILAIPIVTNGLIGAVNRIPFPIALRASSGTRFAYFGVVSRAAIALFFFGIQTYNGAGVIKVMIGAIWPSFLKMKNHIPTSQGITTVDMISYFIFWAFQLPFLFIHPTKLRPIFLIKAIFVPISAFAILGWCIQEAKGTKLGVHYLFDKPPSASGAAFSKAWLYSCNAIIGGYATLGVNIPDFSRYSASKRGLLIQIPWLPIVHLLLCIISVFCASATEAITGKVLWTPMDIMALWPSRAARFFAAVPWVFAQICVNVSANTLSCANDLTLLCPRYINIRRGSLIVAFVGGWAVVPWKILASPTTFYAFISNWSIVLGPLAGLMTCDYYLVKHQRLDVPELYNPHGRYQYWHGFNWRAIAALIIGMSLNIPGFLQSFNSSIEIGWTIWVFKFSWCYGFTSTILSYYVLNLIAPDRNGTVIETAVLPDEYVARRAVEEGFGEGEGKENAKDDYNVVVRPT